MKSAVRLAGWLVLALVWLIPIEQLRAQDRPTRLNVWDIHIGEKAADIPDAFVNYACGTGGGPPSIPLTNFTEFEKCRPDANGLHEVYFEYDDELEYWARALDLKAEIRMYAGTSAYEFPVVASVLFDDAGLVKGERLVTDPRQQLSRDRNEFWVLADFIRHRFGTTSGSAKTYRPMPGRARLAPISSKITARRRRGDCTSFSNSVTSRKRGSNSSTPTPGSPGRKIMRARPALRCTMQHCGS